MASWFVQLGLLDLTSPLEPGPLGGWAVRFGISQDAVTKRFDKRLASTQAPAPTASDTSDVQED